MNPARSRCPIDVDAQFCEFCVRRRDLCAFDAVTIKNSTFDSNTATFFGGAIFNNGGAVSLINSTFAANSAQEGGGIDNYGTMTLINSTVADNTSAGNGGGINNDISGTITIGNTIVADNTASAQARILTATPRATGGIT